MPEPGLLDPIGDTQVPRESSGPHSYTRIPAANRWHFLVVVALTAIVAELLLGPALEAISPAAHSRWQDLLGIAILLVPLVLYLSTLLRGSSSSSADKVDPYVSNGSLFDASADPQFLVDGNGRFQRVNAAFQRTLGYSALAMREQSYLDIVHPDDRSITDREMQGLLAGKPPVLVTNRCRTSAGDFRSLAWNASGHQGGILAVGRDVTDEKNAETRAEHRYGSLMETLRATLDAMVFAVEMRDPHIAGHERL